MVNRRSIWSRHPIRHYLTESGLRCTLSILKRRSTTPSNTFCRPSLLRLLGHRRSIMIHCLPPSRVLGGLLVNTFPANTCIATESSSQASHTCEAKRSHRTTWRQNRLLTLLLRLNFLSSIWCGAIWHWKNVHTDINLNQDNAAGTCHSS